MHKLDMLQSINYAIKSRHKVAKHGEVNFRFLLKSWTRCVRTIEQMGYFGKFTQDTTGCF